MLLNNSRRYTGLKVFENVFVNGNLYCCGETYNGEWKTQQLFNNIAVVHRGQWLVADYHGKNSIVLPIEGNVEDAIEQYRNRTNDRTTQFIVLENSEEVDRYIIHLLITSSFAAPQ